MKRYFFSLHFFFVIVCWCVFFIDTELNFELYEFGVYPRSLRGLRGVLFSPFIHGNFTHLISNTGPYLVLSFVLVEMFSYRKHLIFILIFFLSGFFTWLLGRDVYHIGASSIVYGFASFIIATGMLIKQREYLVLAFIVILLYGGFIWGLLPQTTGVSWEGHVGGVASGILTAFFLRNQHEKKEKREEEANALSTTFDGIDFYYRYKKK